MKLRAGKGIERESKPASKAASSSPLSTSKATKATKANKAELTRKRKGPENAKESVGAGLYPDKKKAKRSNVNDSSRRNDPQPRAAEDGNVTTPRTKVAHKVDTNGSSSAKKDYEVSSPAESNPFCPLVKARIPKSRQAVSRDSQDDTVKPLRTAAHTKSKRKRVESRQDEDLNQMVAVSNARIDGQSVVVLQDNNHISKEVPTRNLEPSELVANHQDDTGVEFLNELWGLNDRPSSPKESKDNSNEMPHLQRVAREHPGQPNKTARSSGGRKEATPKGKDELRETLFGVAVSTIFEESKRQTQSPSTADNDDLLGLKSRNKKFSSGRMKGFVLFKLPEFLRKDLDKAHKLYINSRLNEAEVLAKELLQKSPDSYEPFQLLACIYEDRGEARRAFDMRYFAATLLRSDVELWKQIAAQADELGLHREAWDCICQGLKLTKFTDVEGNKARCLYYVKTPVTDDWERDVGDWKKALNSATWLIDKFPAELSWYEAFVQLTYWYRSKDFERRLLEKLCERLQSISKTSDQLVDLSFVPVRLCLVHAIMMLYLKFSMLSEASIFASAQTMIISTIFASCSSMHTSPMNTLESLGYMKQEFALIASIGRLRSANDSEACRQSLLQETRLFLEMCESFPDFVTNMLKFQPAVVVLYSAADLLCFQRCYEMSAKVCQFLLDSWKGNIDMQQVRAHGLDKFCTVLTQYVCVWGNRYLELSIRTTFGMALLGLRCFEQAESILRRTVHELSRKAKEAGWISDLLVRYQRLLTKGMYVLPWVAPEEVFKHFYRQKPPTQCLATEISLSETGFDATMGQVLPSGSSRQSISSSGSPPAELVNWVKVLDEDIFNPLRELYYRQNGISHLFPYSWSPRLAALSEILGFKQPNPSMSDVALRRLRFLLEMLQVHHFANQSDESVMSATMAIQFALRRRLQPEDFKIMAMVCLWDIKPARSDGKETANVSSSHLLLMANMCNEQYQAAKDANDLHLSWTFFLLSAICSGYMHTVQENLPSLPYSPEFSMVHSLLLKSNIPTRMFSFASHDPEYEKSGPSHVEEGSASSRGRHMSSISRPSPARGGAAITGQDFMTKPSQNPFFRELSLNQRLRGYSKLEQAQAVDLDCRKHAAWTAYSLLSLQGGILPFRSSVQLWDSDLDDIVAHCSRVFAHEYGESDGQVSSSIMSANTVWRGNRNAFQQFFLAIHGYERSLENKVCNDNVAYLRTLRYMDNYSTMRRAIPSYQQSSSTSRGQADRTCHCPKEFLEPLIKIETIFNAARSLQGMGFKEPAVELYKKGLAVHVPYDSDDLGESLRLHYEVFLKCKDIHEDCRPECAYNLSLITGSMDGDRRGSVYEMRKSYLSF